MKTLFVRSATFCLIALSLCPARAAFDPAIVPADAKWVFHLDLNALRESPVGWELIAIAEKDAVIPNSGGIKIDIKKLIATLGSATAYGTTFSHNPSEIDGALVLQGTDDLRKIAEGLAAQFSVSNPEIVTEVKGLPFSAYSIKGEVTVAFPTEPIIIVSRSKPQLLKALELFRGKGSSAARGPSSLKNLIPKTKTLLVLAASEVPNTDGLFPENAPQARILKMASSASVALGNDGKLTTACIQLVATDEEMSDKLLKIVQGLTAMLSLAQSDDQQITDFLRSVKAERVGKTIVLNLSFPSDSLVTIIRGIEQNEQLNKSNSDDAAPRKPAVQGKVVGTWTADQDTGEAEAESESLRYHTVENVALKNGTTIILTGSRNAGENAEIDFVEITPAQGGSPLRFEAENMQLIRARVKKNLHASGGKLIFFKGEGVEHNGNARFVFPGLDGTYTLKIRYAADNSGKVAFTISTLDHEPSATDYNEAPEAPGAPDRPAAK